LQESGLVIIRFIKLGFAASRDNFAPQNKVTRLSDSHYRLTFPMWLILMLSPARSEGL
jgi:hypothetical protein